MVIVNVMSFEISNVVSTFSAGEKTDGKDMASADDDSELPAEYLNSSLSKEAQVSINYNLCRTFPLSYIYATSLGATLV